MWVAAVAATSDDQLLGSAAKGISGRMLVVALRYLEDTCVYLCIQLEWKRWRVGEGRKSQKTRWRRDLRKRKNRGSKEIGK